jgi:hypothetical protein
MRIAFLNLASNSKPRVISALPDHSAVAMTLMPNFDWDRAMVTKDFLHHREFWA